MKLAEVIKTLGQPSAGEFPQAVLEQARAIWPEFLTYLDQLMDKFCAGEPLSDAEDNCLFFGVVLLADRVEVSRFEKLVQLCDGSDEFGSPLDRLLADLITSTLPSIFYVLAAGRAAPLIDLVLSQKSGEYIKNAAVSALFAQLENAQIERSTLERAIPEMIAATAQHSFALCELAQLLIWYGFDEHQASLSAVIDAEDMDEWGLPLETIQAWKSDPAFIPGWHSGQVQAQVDVMDLKSWASFQQPASAKSQAGPKAKPLTTARAPNTEQDIEAMEASLYGEQPYIAPEKIGRNDPCPCGSGKKYK